MTAQHADPGPSRDELAAWLMTVDQDTFRDIVARDVKRHLESDASSALRHPSVLLRWTRMLKVLITDAHVQMAEKGKAREDRAWYASVSRWEERLLHAQSEARTLVDRYHAEIHHEDKLASHRAAADVREAAVTRLVGAHREEYRRYLDEERAIAGLPAKVRPSTAVITFRAAEGSPS